PKRNQKIKVPKSSPRFMFFALSSLSCQLLYTRKNNMARNDLKGKAVLITGGAKNLGGLLSRNFAAKGAKVAIHYNSDSTKADAEKTLTAIQKAGGEAFLFKADL